MVEDYILQDIKEKLKNHKAFQAVIKRAKKIGCVDIEMTSYEKWNYNEPNIPKDDGTFDVEGKSLEDINGRWNWNYLNFKDLYNIVKDLFLYKSFTKTPSSWIWVVDSFKVAKGDLAEEWAEKVVLLDSLKWPGVDENGIMREQRPEDKKLLDKYNKEVEKQLKKIKRKDIINDLLKRCYKLSDAIYVLKTDPTIIICDNKLVPFEMKDGWSDRQLYHIIGTWLYLLGYSYPVRVKEQGEK